MCLLGVCTSYSTVETVLLGDGLYFLIMFPHTLAPLSRHPKSTLGHHLNPAEVVLLLLESFESHMTWKVSFHKKFLIPHRLLRLEIK